MNFKGFKKTHDDENKTVLTNEKGHSITLAKKGLSKGHLDGISKLPLHASEGADLNSQLDSQADFKNQAMASPVPQEEAPEPQAPTQPMGAGPEGTPLASAQNVAPPAQPMQQSPEQTQESTAQSHAIEANQEAVQYAQDLTNGHITPQTYKSLYEKKDTLGKIGTLFGLLVSGAGSGLAHQPNAVLDMMNKEIDRDLEAQKQSKANAQNYFRLNQQNEMNKSGIKRAGAETRGIEAETQIKSDTHAKNQMLLGAIQHMQDGVNKLPQGPQRSQAQQTLDGIRQAGAAEIQQNNEKMGQAIASDPEGDFQQKQKNLRMMSLLGQEGAEGMARSNEDKHVAGFGDASVPVPGDVRQELIAKKEYDQAAKNYVDFAKKHQSNWANLNPKERMEVAKQGAVLGAELQGKYRLKTHGGVYKTGEQEFIQRIIPDSATSWSASFNQIPKVEQTIKDNKVDTSNLAKGYGLPEMQDSKSSSSGGEEGKTGTYKGKPVVLKNGKWEYK